VPLFPCLVPVATFWLLVDRLNVPETQLAFGLPAPPVTPAVWQVKVTAEIGTLGQFDIVVELPLTASVHEWLGEPLDSVHVTFATLRPLTGWPVSGSDELKEIVPGLTCRFVIVAASGGGAATLARTGRWGGLSAAPPVAHAISKTQVEALSLIFHLLRLN
jgi:hypothetical protein